MTNATQRQHIERNDVSIAPYIASFEQHLIDEDKSELTRKNYLLDLKGFVDWSKDNVEGVHTGTPPENMGKKAKEKFAQYFSKTGSNNIQHRNTKRNNKRNNKRNTDENTTQHNRNTFATLTIFDLSIFDAIEHAEEYVDYLQNESDYAVTTQNRRLGTLRTFFTFLVEHHGLRFNPLEDAKQRKAKSVKRNYLKEYEIVDILGVIDTFDRKGEYFKTRDKAIIRLLAFCGLRVHELSNLKVKDIDIEGMKVKVAEGVARTIPFGTATRDILLNWLNMRKGGSDDWLFHSLRSDRMSERGIQHMTKRLSRASEIDFTPADLRNTYMKRTLKNNTLEVAQQLIGHEDSNTTKRYKGEL